MRLLLDQGLPRGACELVARHGHEVVHTGDVGLSLATDEVILDWAEAEDRVLVTLDADFHAILARRGAARPSVIRLRVEGLRAEELAALLARVVASSEAALKVGAAVTVGPDGETTRVRALPL